MGIKVDLFSGYKMKGDDYYKIVAAIARKILREFYKKAHETNPDAPLPHPRSEYQWNQ